MDLRHHTSLKELVALAAPVPLDQPGMTAAPTRPEPERDHFGRYLIPDPVSGEKRAWTRATTWAKSVADTFALTKWETRKVAIGLTLRKDLLAAVSGVLAVHDPDSKDGKKLLNQLVEQAKDAARAAERANLGNALHHHTQAIDMGRPAAYIPAPLDKDIEAWRKAMLGVSVSPNYVERICLLPELGVAGTLDRLACFSHSKLPMIADLKTGADVLEFGMTEIVIQLSLYAHSTYIYDTESKQFFGMPEVDKKRALVIWLPAEAARCELLIADVEAGWEMAQVCGTVRRWRSRKNLVESLLEAK